MEVGLSNYHTIKDYSLYLVSAFTTTMQIQWCFAQWHYPSDVTPIAAPVLMRASGVIKPLSIAGGLPGVYAPGELNAVCRRCTRFGAALPAALLPVARKTVRCMASGRLRLQKLIPKSAIERLHKWVLPG